MNTFILCLFISLSVFAHEGDHGPATFQAKHGGVVQSLETINLELVQDGKFLKLYVYDAKGNPGRASQYPVSGKILLPMKKTAAIQLVDKGEYWEAAYTPPADTHRYTLQLRIEQGGHTDTVPLTIEQRKKK